MAADRGTSNPGAGKTAASSLRWHRRWFAGLFVAAGLAGGCEDGPVEDDSQAGRDVPEVFDGCPDDAAEGALVQISETRSCLCEDGSDSTQVCLSSGEFGSCDCVGSGW